MTRYYLAFDLSEFAQVAEWQLRRLYDRLDAEAAKEHLEWISENNVAGHVQYFIEDELTNS
jgi:hypothetical protein